MKPLAIHARTGSFSDRWIGFCQEYDGALYTGQLLPLGHHGQAPGDIRITMAHRPQGRH